MLFICEKCNKIYKNAYVRKVMILEQKTFFKLKGEYEHQLKVRDTDQECIIEDAMCIIHKDDTGRYYKIDSSFLDKLSNADLSYVFSLFKKDSNKSFNIESIDLSILSAQEAFNLRRILKIPQTGIKWR